VFRPRAIVSTSGSSGTLSAYRIGLAALRARQPGAAVATHPSGKMFAPPQADSVC
jgi:hypothetical protein